MDQTMKAFKALADESRIRILWMLEEKPLCVCEIRASLSLSQSSISRHLQLLNEAGFVTTKRSGQWKEYLLNPTPALLIQGLITQVRTAALLDPEAKTLRDLAKKVCRDKICG
jgi:ArsR family transcriptional regulator